MNDVKLAEMMKNMPEDMIAESAEFAPDKAGNTLTTKAAGAARANVSTVKRSSGFRVHPALIAASVILIVAALTGITVGVVKNLSDSKKPVQQGGIDQETDMITQYTPGPTLAPGPTATAGQIDFGNVELVDVSSILGENGFGTGQLQLPGEDGELKNTAELFSAMLSAQETGNTGPVIWDRDPLLADSWLYMIGDADQEPMLASRISELTPREIEGNARLFRCSMRWFDFNILLIDGTIYYTLDRPDLAVDSAVMYDYDGNGIEDILLVFTEKEKEDVQYSNAHAPAVSRYWKGFYFFDMVKKEYVKVCEYYAPLNDVPMILSNGGEAYIWLSSSKMGGKISMKENGFTVGGADPDEFFDVLYYTSTVEKPSNEIKLVFNLTKRTRIDMNKDRPSYTVNYASGSAELSGGWYREKIRENIDTLPVFQIGASDMMQLDFYWTGLPVEVDILIVDFDALIRDSYARDEARASCVYPIYNNTFTISVDKTVLIMLTTDYLAPNRSKYADCYAFFLAYENDMPLPTLQPTEIPPWLLPTDAPTAADPTPTPGPTAIPWDDPKSVVGIADGNRFLTAYQGFSMSGLEAPYKYYYFNGSEMDEVLWSGFDQTIMTTMRNIAEKCKNKESSFVAISVGKEFTLEPVSKGEIICVDVYAVNDSENMNDIAPELIAEGLSYDEFMGSAASSMDFRIALNGETLPCFAVFYVKMTGQFMSVTGEYEYAVKQCVIPFIP